jgi:hypothetical protein
VKKSTRHSEILGKFGEYTICNWLSKLGFEVCVVNHTGLDIIASIPGTDKRLGITVKSRTRTSGKESERVGIFKPGDREKLRRACESFDCKPWLAIYVERETAADLYLTSLENYDRKYGGTSGAEESWYMTGKRKGSYLQDPGIFYISLTFESNNWHRLPASFK